MYPEQPMIPLTEVLQREYEEESTFHICKKHFDNLEKNWKVCDYCQYTGLYRGAVHNNCNLKYKIPKYIPIVFYNLNDDAHIFIRQPGEKVQTKDIGVIAENKEKYVSFNVKIDVQLQCKDKRSEGKPVTKKIELKFIDSFSFIASSLDS